MLEQVVLVALVGVGLAYTLAKLEGPFGVATWLKGAILNASWAPGWLQQGVECVYCWSFWLTLAVTAATVGVEDMTGLVQVWLAAFGLTVVLLLWAGQ